MKVTVNGVEISLFEGAMVEHAVRKYSSQLLDKLKKGTATITDGFGNQVSLSGRLSEGDVLTVQIAANT